MLKTGKKYSEKAISTPEYAYDMPIFSIHIHGRNFVINKIIDGHKVLPNEVKGAFALGCSRVLKNNDHFFEKTVDYLKKPNQFYSKGRYFNNKALKNI